MANATANRLMVVLGAGASHDCADRDTAAQVNDDYRPPLARDIFARNFDRILSHYPAVTARLDELRTKLAKGGNFEEIFRALLESAERHQNYWPLQLPLYLRELFWTISLDYLRGSSKFDTLVRRVLESYFEEVMFFNLNYDLFLEDALTNYDHHEFGALSSYIPVSKKWRHVKPHGSVNWAKILENSPVDGTGRPVPSRLQEMPVFSSELRVVMWNRHSNDFYIPGGGPPGYLYPQVVVPTDRPKTFVCPKDHVDQARTFVQNCGDFLLIGFSGRDEDVVDLLQAMPSHSQLAIVGKGDARTIFKRISSSVRSLKSKKLALSFHDIGFSKFVGNEAFERLLGGESVSGLRKRSPARNI
jgi:hypothetical protein